MQETNSLSYNKEDVFYAHEALDRTYLLMETIETYLLYHPHIENNEEYRKLIQEAFDKLHEVYQALGRENAIRKL